MRQRGWASLVVAASICVAASACAQPAPADPPPGHVRIVEHQFVPRTIEVTAGETVTWTSEDAGHHWVRSVPPEGAAPGAPNVLESGDLGHAQSWTWSATAPGEYRYYCKIHNYMKGTVIVREPEGRH